MDNLPSGFLGSSATPIHGPASPSVQSDKTADKGKSSETGSKTGHLPSTSKTKLPKTVSQQDASSKATGAKTHATFAEALPQLKPGEKYLDGEKLLKGRTAKEGSREQFKAIHRDFYLNQAMHLAAIEKATDPALKEKLELGLMRGYAKAAKVGKENAEALGIQTSPFVQRDNEYHRSSPGNTLVARLHGAYAEAMELDLNDQDFRLVDSPLVMEVLNRHLSNPGLDLAIDSPAKFKGLVDQLLADAKNGNYPANKLLIDCTGIFPATKEPKEIKDLAQELEKVVLEKVSAFAKQNPEVDITKLQGMLKQLYVVAMTEFKGQSVMLLPHFLDNPRTIQNDEHKRFVTSQKHTERNEFIGQLRGFITGAGFVLSPDQARKAWLAVTDFHEIMDNANLFLAELATSGTGIPEVAKSCRDFVANPVFQSFRDLGKAQDAPPYLQVMPEATMLLLEGLAKIHPTDGGIDKVFKDNGIGDLLQVSYFRVANAAREAILRKDDQIAFNNQIELMHNEIQMILSIVEPYHPGDLEKAVLDKLSKGRGAVIPAGYDKPHVHLKASAMHAMASAIAGVERQKGTNQLNVVALKDCYYETADSKDYGMLDRSQAHSLSFLDGDAFNKGGIDQAFAGANVKLPIDLFVCEFHHNISMSRTDYKPENITAQLKAMAQKGMLADPCTIMIDTTINLEKADDVRQFLSDPDIKKMVDDGKLNIVLVRSAQKFDMLGMDNYYGGISVCINDPVKFSEFNTRMDDPQDQLTDINYQGLTHMQTHGGDSIDKYRQGIMENTQRLYSMLPEKAVYQEGTHNLMQISRIEDERVVFLDIKFPKLPKAAEAFESRLKEFALQEGLPFTTRASFGFANTNFTSIGDEKKRLNPGLEDPRQLERYAAFFEAAQKTVESVMKHHSKAAANLNDSKNKDLIENKLSDKLAELKIPKPKTKK
ncbi:hypothetical protein [Estrella lausannensis]|uniref:Uncharacterized protein n=1 Tax=Estrella lausannensis TaxID=483423 RepID=A0A0H5DQY4_9BACT|nr:hypothetical protein [Estrella lausannensis]CRX38982.1 hypothetical protein ELAC_1655 [Estrella lausannensis]